MTVALRDALRLSGRLVQAAGLTASAAEDTAWALLLAECWGLPSHGLSRLPHYLRRLAAGGYRPDAELTVRTDTGPMVSYDGGAGLGHWQLWHGARVAAERARQYGVGLVAVGNSGHCGALGVYTVPVLRAGMAGLVFSNGPAVMPPWGGRTPVVSTSPLAAGFPARPRPIVVDLASSTVARGRIAQRAATGEPLPAGWALDAEGVPTTDPTAALAGMLAPLGGAKGFALALLVESMTAGLVGPALSTDVADMFDPAEDQLPQRIAHLVVALDPARTDGGSGAADRLTRLSTQVTRAGGRVPGAARAMPDELSPDTPVPVPEKLRAELDEWAARLGVPGW